MQHIPRRDSAWRAAALTIALIAVGCGDDETTTTTTGAGSDAEQRIDSAVSSCQDSAGQVGDAAVALSSAADSCRNTVGQLPSGQAQAALGELCDAIAGAG